MKKSKSFARKIVAVILSILMIASTFTGVLTVYADSTDDYHDSNLAANFMAWAETTDNQTCEALLDWVDETLQKADIDPIQFSGNYVVVNIDLNIYLDSVDGLFDAVDQVDTLLDSYGGLLGGDVNNIRLNPIADDLTPATSGDGIISACNVSYRAKYDAKTLVMALAETIYYNSNDNTSSKRTNSNVIGQFIKGDLNLGSILSGIVDVYGLIGNLGNLGMWDGYESNLVYNILAQVILTQTNWFSESDVKAYQKGLGDTTKGDDVTAKTWNFDTVLFEKLSTELLSKISVKMTYALEKVTDSEGNVTYEPTDSSETRYKKIKAYLTENGMAETDANIQKAIIALNEKNGTNWDPNLRYDMGDGMIYIFRYATSATEDETFTIKPTDKLFDLIDRGLSIAWKTVLRPTLQTLRVNNSMDWYEDHGGNFDNNYYYWLAESGNLDTTNWKNNYTMDKFNLYANAVYKDYGCSSVAEFTAKVKKTFDYDRTEVDDPEYNWRDIDEADNYTTESDSKESILFGKLRYSPMADLIFDMQTGPINLYIMQTGFSNLETFIDNYIAEIDSDTRTYSNVIAALNDALVAAVKDFFPDSDNIGLGDGKNKVTTNISLPTMTTVNTTDIATIASTIIENAMKLFEYGCNVTDENMLSAFYHNNNITDKTTSSHLSESNFEEAMVPTAIACITIIKETRQIHNEDWDYATDAEGVAYVALREYLSYVLPNKDYDQLVSTDNGKYEAIKDVNKDGSCDLYLDVILPMARDAVGYLLNSVVPCRDADGNVWDVYTSDPATDQTTLFDILNSIVCYYASTDSFAEPDWNTTASTTYGKGVAALLGAVDSNGNCTVTMKNDLWTNIDNIANALWPTLGTLQYGTTNKAGQFDSEELIYTRVIKSLLNISDVQSSTGKQGLTSLLEQLLTVFTAEPIMNKGVDALVYDEVVASLVNSIFGSRVTGEYYEEIIPTSDELNSDTPFDSLLTHDVFAIYKGDADKENGVLCNLISNIFGFFGGATEITNSTMGDGSWQGAMFAVKAVSYFIDGFVPQLKDHQFNAATISVSDPSRSNVAAGASLGNSTVLTITNNATGLNRFYKNSDGKIVADDRYFIKVTNVTYESSPAGLSLTLDNTTGVIAPEESMKINVTGNNPSKNTLVTFKLEYDVYLGTNTDKTKQLLYSDQTATCYLNFSMDKDWASSTLSNTDSNTGAKYPSIDDTNSVTAYNNGYAYKNLVVTNDNPSAVNSYGITVKGIYGLFADEGDEDWYYSYASFDPSTGNLLKSNYYDFKIDNGDWDCGDTYDVEKTDEEGTVIGSTTVSQGYTKDEMSAKWTEEGISEVKDSKGNVTGYTQNGEPVTITTRAHIALTLADDPDRNVYHTIEKNSDGTYSSITVNYKAVTGGAVTAATPTHGINFASIAYSSANENVKWLQYDGTTSIEAGNYAMQLYGWDADGEPIALCDTDTETYTNVVVANTDGADELQSVYEDYQSQMAPYQASDYNDYDSTQKYSLVNDNLQSTFKKVVQNISAPITLSNATELISTYETVATVSSTTSTTGDQAFKPATVSSTKDTMSSTFYDDGTYYYYDADHKFPVYSSTPLETSDVTNGKDPVGQAVTNVNGVWYLANDIQYEYEWDTEKYSPYPYYAKTETQATKTTETTESGKTVEKVEPLYNQVQYKYYTTAGKTVGHSDDWTYKIAITQETIKENDGTDYRGYYTKLEDALEYNVAQALDNVDTSLMTQITTGIIADRKGKTSVDYDVASYERMVQIAKDGETLVTNTGKKDSDGNIIYTTSATSVEIKEAKRLYDKYKALAEQYCRGYEGDKIEAEIKHLTGTTKDKISVTIDEENKTAEITISDKDASAEYGSIDSTGKLVNAGSTEFHEDSWNDFVYALAEAVQTAQAEKEENILGTYESKKALVISENALDPVTGYTVSGTVTEAVDRTGTAGTYALSGIKVVADGKTLATTDANGAFTAVIPLGTKAVKFEMDGAVSRTVNFDGATSVSNVKVGVVALDFNNDGKINATDIALGSKNNKEQLTTVTGAKEILRQGVEYSDTLS